VPCHAKQVSAWSAYILKSCLYKLSDINLTISNLRSQLSLVDYCHTSYGSVYWPTDRGYLWHLSAQICIRIHFYCTKWDKIDTKLWFSS